MKDFLSAIENLEVNLSKTYASSLGSGVSPTGLRGGAPCRNFCTDFAFQSAFKFQCFAIESFLYALYIIS